MDSENKITVRRFRSGTPLRSGLMTTQKGKSSIALMLQKWINSPTHFTFTSRPAHSLL